MNMNVVPQYYKNIIATNGLRQYAGLFGQMVSEPFLSHQKHRQRHNAAD